MQKLISFLSVAFCTTILFTACEPKEPSGNTPTTDEGVVINGVKWATRNVDAPATFAEKPESFGMFYQWNRKIGWSSTDPMRNSNGGDTWDSTNAEGTKWALENDPCPNGWRVPTITEFYQCLLADETKVKNEWTTLNGVNGYKLTDKDTGNFIFMPAAGSRYYSNGALESVGYGLYWSSSKSDTYASGWSFGSGGIDTDSGSTRARGYSVRCVKE